MECRTIRLTGEHALNYNGQKRLWWAYLYLVRETCRVSTDFAYLLGMMLPSLEFGTREFTFLVPAESTERYSQHLNAVLAEMQQNPSYHRLFEATLFEFGLESNFAFDQRYVTFQKTVQAARSITNGA